MGLLDMLMPGNPFSGWLDQNRNSITQSFSGMVGAGNDPRMALTGFVKGFDGKGGLMHGRSVDEENAIIRQKQAEQQAAIEQQQNQQNYTIQALQKAGRQDLIDAINGGMSVADAWNNYLKPSDNGFTLGPGDTRFGPDGKPIASGVPTIKTEAAPTGYRYDPTGNLSFIPGGPADPSTAGKTTEATRRNQQLASVIVPELTSLIGDGSPQNPGTFDALANPQDQMRAMSGDAGMAVGLGPSPAYQQARNSLTTIVASYLYSVSGATANPGEVEKQVEVLTPKIGESAESVAAKKLRLQQMVKAVEAAATGTPIDITGGGPTLAPGPRANTAAPSGPVDYRTYFGGQ